MKAKIFINFLIFNLSFLFCVAQTDTMLIVRPGGQAMLGFIARRPTTIKTNDKNDYI